MHTVIPSKFSISTQTIENAREHGKPVVSIEIGEYAGEVVYWSNQRFNDFCKWNEIADSAVASPLFEAAKKVHLKAEMTRLEKVETVDVKQTPKWKGGKFVIESSFIKRHNADANNENDAYLVRQAGIKKALESQKYQEKVSMFLAGKNPNAKFESKAA